MRKFAIAMLSITASIACLIGTPARAEVQYPWCAQYRSAFGATNCGFVTYKQCLDTISGVGGICTRNPAYQPSRSKRKQPTY